MKNKEGEKCNTIENESLIDDNQLQDALQKELAQMKYQNDDDDSILNKSNDSISAFRNYAHNQFTKLQVNKVGIQETEEWKNLISKNAKRQQMLKEMEEHIFQLKKLTAMPQENQNNMSIISDRSTINSNAKQQQ